LDKQGYIVESPEFNVTLIGILVSVFFYEVRAHNFVSIKLKTQLCHKFWHAYQMCNIAYEVLK